MKRKETINLTYKWHVVIQIGWIGFLMIPLFFTGCEIRELDPETGEAIILERADRFDAARYVNDIWEGDVMQLVREEALELEALLLELKNNPAEAQELGHREVNQPASFLVRGTAEVVEVDTSSRVGLLRLGKTESVADFDIFLHIGPVIPGTSLRDAIPFISVDDFTNQIEYADASRALHNRILETELADLDVDQLEGKTLTFHGAFTFSEDRVAITPVTIEIINQ